MFKIIVYVILLMPFALTIFWAARYMYLEIKKTVHLRKMSKDERIEIIANNIMTYVEYFRDMPSDMKKELIISELNDPLLLTSW